MESGTYLAENKQECLADLIVGFVKQGIKTTTNHGS